MAVPVEKAANIDLMYYFDGDDCAQGALIGHDDISAYFVPVGRYPWRELPKASRPARDKGTEAAIAPLTKDKEGLAFWVKTGKGDWVLAGITRIQPVTYADLRGGVVPELELEWRCSDTQAQPEPRSEGE